MYTVSFIVGNILPKSVKCIHSATKKELLKKPTVDGLLMEDMAAREHSYSAGWLKVLQAAEATSVSRGFMGFGVQGLGLRSS